DGKLKWPLPLKSSTFKENREKLDKLAPQALKEAQGGEVDADTLNGTIEAQKSLIAELKGQIEAMTPNDYIKAKRYLTEIEGTIKALQDPQIANYVTRKWSARGNSVPELVSDMSRQGLRFAAATSGDQAAYVALHRALADFDTAMGAQVAQQ